MAREKQSVYIQDGGDTYRFDGVIKIDHQSSLKIEDDPADAKGDKYTNNAAVEPDRVTMDIVMSDAIGERDAFTSGDESRTVSAYQKLKELQRGRTLVVLTTRLDTYTDMLIEAINANEDEEHTYGMVATVVFKHRLTPPAPAKKGNRGGATDNGDTGAVETKDESLLYQGLGKKEASRGGAKSSGGGSAVVYVLQ